MSLKTRYEFTLPRGYVDRDGGLHRDGVMRLATARDELEPLRDPTISGPDDPRLTIVVLARVVETLGTLSWSRRTRSRASSRRTWRSCRTSTA